MDAVGICRICALCMEGLLGSSQRPYKVDIIPLQEKEIKAQGGEATYSRAHSLAKSEWLAEWGMTALEPWTPKLVVFFSTGLSLSLPPFHLSLPNNIKTTITGKK